MDKKHFINLAIILFVGVIAYVNSFGNGFIWEDKQLIIDNPYIKSFAGTPHIFSKGFFENNEGFNFYRPLALFLNAADYSIWRLNPAGYHLTNFLLHFLSACLIYFVLFRFIGSHIFSVFLSLIFITHPSATEAITYIPGRADPLALIFILASFLLFMRSLCALSLISFGMACLSKETAIIFPAFLFMYAIWRDRKATIISGISLTWPYFIISAGALLLRYMVLSAGGNISVNEPLLSLPIRIINLPLIILRYIRMFFLPKPFVFDQTVNFYASIFNIPVMAGIALTIVACALIIKYFRSKSVLGSIWFLTFILPVSGIIPINAPIYHHWLYIPCLGILLISDDILVKLSAIFNHKAAFKYILLISGIIILSLFIALTARQNRYFKDNMTFYKETIKHSPKSSRMHYNLGLLYEQNNRPEEAIDSFKKAIEVRPDYPEAYARLGLTYQNESRIDEAERTLNKGIEIAPKSYLLYYYLANLYNDTGRISMSIQQYKKALDLRPGNPDIYFDLGRAYDRAGDNDDAIRAYQKTIELNPAYIDAYTNMGSIYAQTGNFAKAKAAWESGLKLAPSNEDLKQNLSQLSKIQKSTR